MDALDRFDRALVIRPDDSLVLNNRGVALNALGRHGDALASYNKALAITPDYVRALYNRGRALDELHRYDEALACYNKVLAFEPDHVVAHNNRGATLDTLGRHDEAVDSFDRALALQPDYAEALSNRGTALAELDRPGDALASYAAALALDPDYVDGHWNRSLVLLRQGSYGPGWAGYEWRRKKDDWEIRNLPGPEWDGAPGRRVFLYAEQALGDTIQFARFARMVGAAGNDVILEVQPPLARLMQTLDGVSIIGRGAPLPAFDCHLPLMSVPHVLRLPDVAVDGAYLAAEPNLVECWGRALAGDGVKVGIAWQGNPRAPGDRGRSIPLAAFQPLLRLSGVRFISLQKGHGVEQLADLPAGMTVETLGDDFDAEKDAFIDTAAVMKNLDLVITSDTAVANLAGALGVPIWIALKHVPDWRWMAGGEMSPWYPTARLFRQTRRGAWDDVFERIAIELARFANESRTGDFAMAPLAPLVPVSIGELIDRMTILEIKAERIGDAGKAANVRKELRMLADAHTWQAADGEEMARLKNELREVNEMLWEIEDLIRACEREQHFGAEFVALARSVYRTNDRRSALKRRINELCGSPIVEEKLYSQYS